MRERETERRGEGANGYQGLHLETLGAREQRSGLIRNSSESRSTTQGRTDGKLETTTSSRRAEPSQGRGSRLIGSKRFAKQAGGQVREADCLAGKLASAAGGACPPELDSRAVGLHQLALEGAGSSSSSIQSQLFALIGALLLILYLVNLVQRSMTNLLTKILGGERRRSLAGGGVASGATLDRAVGQQATGGIAQSQSSSTLSLPPNSSPPSPQPQAAQGHQHRRASRSSIHSVSAMLLSAITSGLGSNSQTGNGN